MGSLLAPLCLLAAAVLGGERSAQSAGATANEVRWSYGPFRFESEPVVAGERLVVAGRDATGRRALVVLDERSGRVLSRTLLAASQPLELAAAGERVAVRSAANRVDLYRMRGARLLTERSFVHADSVSAPRLVGEELALREGDELALYDLDRREPRWRAQVPGAFHGAPELVDAGVLAGWYETSGAVHLAWLERASGRVLGDLVLGRNRAGRGPDERDALVVVPHSGSIFVALAPGLASTTGAELGWARVPFDGERFGSPVTLHDLLAPPLELVDGWVAPARTSAGATRWILARHDAARADGHERVIELAAPEHHAWLAASTVPAARAGDALYLGPCAADARSLQVLWRRERGPSFRPVPLADGLLVIEDELLHRLGGPPPAPDAARTRARTLAEQREQALGERLAQIALQGLRAGDRELATRLVDEAEALGATVRVVALVRAGIERLAPGTALRPAERTALVGAEGEARAELLDELAEAARNVRDSTERRALLTELFGRALDHAGGVRVLHELLPEGARVESGQALAWLEFLALAAERPIELVSAPAEGARPTPAQERLRTEQEGWRADAAAFGSERLLVVTAAAAPDAVARALHAGELVCDVLELTFGGTRAAPGRLEVVLYPTRDEYLAHSGSDLGGLETVLGFTAGHFDLAAEVSRLYLPSDDADSARLLGVSAHELTHHWLATRSTFGPPRSTPSAPGFWVVEAIATWVEELRLDVRDRSWASDPARAASLDTVANAGPQDLLPWQGFLAASFDDFAKLETRTTCTLSLDWQLGARAPRSPMQLFYAQGGALAHYLHDAEGGRWRAVLLRTVEGYYRGEPLDVAALLGVTPEELGRRVTAWAGSVMRAGIDELR